MLQQHRSISVSPQTFRSARELSALPEKYVHVKNVNTLRGSESNARQSASKKKKMKMKKKRRNISKGRNETREFNVEPVSLWKSVGVQLEKSLHVMWEIFSRWPSAFHRPRRLYLSERAPRPGAGQVEWRREKKKNLSSAPQGYRNEMDFCFRYFFFAFFSRDENCHVSLSENVGCHLFEDKRISRSRLAPAKICVFLLFMRLLSRAFLYHPLFLLRPPMQPVT